MIAAEQGRSSWPIWWKSQMVLGVGPVRVADHGVLVAGHVYSSLLRMVLMLRSWCFRPYRVAMSEARSSTASPSLRVAGSVSRMWACAVSIWTRWSGVSKLPLLRAVSM